MKPGYQYATVIFTILLGKKNYVSAKSMRADNKYIVEYSKDSEDSIAFITDMEAQQFIGRIHNPHDRVYESETAEVPKQSLAPAKLPKEKIA